MAPRRTAGGQGLNQAWPVALALGVIFVAVVVQVISHPEVIGAPAASEPSLADAPRDYGAERFTAIAVAHERVKAVLKDPDSADFREDYVINSSLPIVCGQVNARNSFGGFGGYSPYVVVGGIADVRGGDDDAGFVRTYNSLCTDKPARRRQAHHHARAHVPTQPASPTSTQQPKAPVEPPTILAPLGVISTPGRHGQG